MGVVKVYYLSRRPLNGIVKPYVPLNHLTWLGYADRKTLRIPVYPTVYHAILALPYKRKRRKMWVNCAIIDKDKLYVPKHPQSPTSTISREKWLLEPTNFHAVERIKLIDKVGARYPYYYGKYKTSYLYEWWWYPIEDAPK